MELALVYVHFDANEWDVKRAIGEVLHGEEFFNANDPKDRPVNFKVTLNAGAGGVQNNGSGSLVLPNRKIGDKLMRWLHSQGNAVRVHGRKMRFLHSTNKPDYGLAHILEKTPYLPPEIEEERENILRVLDVGIYVDKVQLGILYRRVGTGRNASRTFSPEFEISHRNKGAGLLAFEYDHKLIRITLGDPMTEEIAHNIAINFSNIRRMAVGHDFGNPFVCFDLIVPPMFERQPINRELIGAEWKDNRKFRQRLDSINEAHAVVAPYCYQMRLILHHTQDIQDFARLCTVAGLQRPIEARVDSFEEHFFSQKKLNNVRKWLQGFVWPVAFQVEALLRNGLLHTEDLLNDFHDPINELYSRRRDMAADILRLFTEALCSRDPQESPLECFERVCVSNADKTPIPLPLGTFSCHHVTFTPTRVVLEGPYVIQSNRVIRLYPDHQEHFVRVDFRDEDRLQYRWAREVDGTTLLIERVGGVLKNGFELGGRHFEFLAYSQSALREHAVWFMNPFHHPEQGWVTAQKIRDGLGDFSKVIKAPSKYAARIAQAFTATDPSVKITQDQWEEVVDLGENPYEFTDGCGTISPMLGDMIWDALCAARPENQRRTIKPSAYQIRFLGFKGMVAIDEQLEGVKMRLRPSMKKFMSLNEESAMIEIAQAFDRPRPSFLNRPLVMVMEDRGVEKTAFIDLQEKAKAEVYTASDSIERCVSLLRGQSLGPGYRLAFILQCLKNIGMGLADERNVQVLDDPFIDRLIHYAKNHVLRDMKHSARIPIPDSYLLVGVADEGPAYEAADLENVFKLGEGEIFVCVQGPDDPEPSYLKGPVVITRSPVVHPGDVQRVRAIGAPPPDRPCFFRNLKNVVVLPSVGSRSLASCLGGGDLDGDEYTIIKYGPLLFTEHTDPASYESLGTRELERVSTVEDICDFIVEYINSDVLGMLSIRHLIIADQSKNGTKDKSCIQLAELCSHAVDYPKNGFPVDIHDAPRTLIPFKPDWHQAEVADPRASDYYESARALGEIFRRITIVPPPMQFQGSTAAKCDRPKPLSDAISKALKPYIERQLNYFHNEDKDVAEFTDLFHKYRDELRYICMTHALSDAPDVRLMEEEVVIGTILAKCSQHRWRQDRTYRMRLHSSMLARDVRMKLFKHNNFPEPPTSGELVYGLTQAWLAWDFSMRNKSLFGANSFGLIALSVVFNILEQLPDGLPAKDPAAVDALEGAQDVVSFDSDYYAEY